jgi:hypothetical protein
MPGTKEELDEYLRIQLRSETNILLLKESKGEKYV